MSSNNRLGENKFPQRDDRGLPPEEPAAEPRSAEVEALVAAAGNYVWPSDDLRPRVLEAARERAGQRQTLYRLAAMTVAAALCVMTGVSVSQHLHANAESAAMPRGERLEQLVDAHAASSGESPAGALADIVQQWRSEWASRLSKGAAPRAEKSGSGQ